MHDGKIKGLKNTLRRSVRRVWNTEPRTARRRKRSTRGLVFPKGVNEPAESADPGTGTGAMVAGSLFGERRYTVPCLLLCKRNLGSGGHAEKVHP